MDALLPGDDRDDIVEEFYLNNLPRPARVRATSSRDDPEEETRDRPGRIKSKRNRPTRKPKPSTNSTTPKAKCSGHLDEQAYATKFFDLLAPGGSNRRRRRP